MFVSSGIGCYSYPVAFYPHTSADLLTPFQYRPGYAATLPTVSANRLPAAYHRHYLDRVDSIIPLVPTAACRLPALPHLPGGWRSLRLAGNRVVLHTVVLFIANAGCT